MNHPQPPPDGAGRAEFEAWAQSCGHSTELWSMHGHPDDDPEYYWAHTQSLWAAWQAARSRPAPPAAEPVAEILEVEKRHAKDGRAVYWKHGVIPPVGTKLYPAPPAPAGDALLRDINDWLACRIDCYTHNNPPGKCNCGAVGLSDRIDAALKDSGGGK